MPLQRSDLGAYSRLVCFLETLGAVKTASALFSKDNNTSADIEKCQFFYEQICSLIRNADLVIVEVTTPSLRVGYEIAYAEAFSKPVLALHKTNDLLYEGQPLSPFLQGNKRIAICNYEHTDQVGDPVMSMEDLWGQDMRGIKIDQSVSGLYIVLFIFFRAQAIAHCRSFFMKACKRAQSRGTSLYTFFISDPYLSHDVALCR